MLRFSKCVGGNKLYRSKRAVLTVENLAVRQGALLKRIGYLGVLGFSGQILLKVAGAKGSSTEGTIIDQRKYWRNGDDKTEVS